MSINGYLLDTNIATALKHQYALVSRDSDMNFVQAEYGLTHIVI